MKSVRNIGIIVVVFVLIAALFFVITSKSRANNQLKIVTKPIDTTLFIQKDSIPACCSKKPVRGMTKPSK